MKGKSLSRVRLLVTSWTAAYQAPPSMGFSRQEYWSGLPLPSLNKVDNSLQSQALPPLWSCLSQAPPPYFIPSTVVSFQVSQRNQAPLCLLATSMLFPLPGLLFLIMFLQGSPVSLHSSGSSTSSEMLFDVSSYPLPSYLVLFLQNYLRN